MNLARLTIDQLALALAGEERLPLDAVLEECRRRQRRLDAEEMAREIRDHERESMTGDHIWLLTRLAAGLAALGVWKLVGYFLTGEW